MKERPILFSSPMVRAILDGRKTQTRRVVKPQPESGHDGEPYWHVGGYRAWQFRGIADPLRMGTNNPLVCPYGQPGDRLWVRETFAPLGNVGDARAPEFIYRADFEPCRGGEHYTRERGDGTYEDAGIGRWTPSIHMPRAASRITLEVTGVRFERLNEISGKDAAAEGIQFKGLGAGVPLRGNIWRQNIDGFHKLWESINGPGSWDANPWVWVVEFRRL